MPDFIDLVKEAPAYRQTFFLWPRQWQAYNLSIQFNWRVVPFKESEAGNVPSEPGIYAFLIQPRIADQLDASYLIYIGKHETSLRKRFREYIKEAMSLVGRPKIVRFFQLYEGFLSFMYSVPEISDPLATVEDALLNAFIPPANDFYPSQIRRVMNAF